MNLEDVLTSDVFSFFYYSNRHIFLFEFLCRIGIIATKDQLDCAEFLFWPRFQEKTEPDLILIVSKYYILIEATYRSDFNKGTEKCKSQLIREIEAGQIESRNLGKEFIILAITKDPYKIKEKFISAQEEKEIDIHWISWQSISEILTETLKSGMIIDKRDKLYAEDLLQTLDKKNLRKYHNLQKVLVNEKQLST